MGVSFLIVPLFERGPIFSVVTFKIAESGNKLWTLFRKAFCSSNVGAALSLFILLSLNWEQLPALADTFGL